MTSLTRFHLASVISRVPSAGHPRTPRPVPAFRPIAQRPSVGECSIVSVCFDRVIAT